jgi:hypothetical protein
LFFYVNVICMAEQAENELTATTTGAATTGREIH